MQIPMAHEKVLYSFSYSIAEFSLGNETMKVGIASTEGKYM